MKRFFRYVIFSFLIFNCFSNFYAQEDLKLWYKSPARDWMTEALPIGNGKIGAMIFGGVHKERLTLNEKSLWEGGRGDFSAYNSGIIEGGYKHLNEIRSLISEAKYDEALTLGNRYLVGDNSGYGAYQVFADLILEFNTFGKRVKNYKRSLDLETAIHTVEYQLNNTKYTRKVFASYPNNVIVMEIKAEGDDKLNFKLKLDSPISTKSYRKSLGLGKSSYKVKSGRAISIISESNDNWGKLTLNGKLLNNGMEYQGVVYLKSEGGEIGADSISKKQGKKSLVVKNAKSVLIIFTAATDYLPKYPNYKGNNFIEKNRVAIDNSINKKYEELEKIHLSDYQKLFKRVSINISNNKKFNNSCTTEERLKNFNKTEDLSLIDLVYQYGRYLLISSSREGALPANLQGMWNNSTAPPWSCDYHTNINLQMNYWAAEVSALGECHKALLDYIPTLVEPGKRSAKAYFNSRGWVVHTMNNPFGFTAPGWDVRWGFFPAGAAWLSQHLYQHYLFSKDINFLKNSAWPVMKESSLFWLDYLQENENGVLVSSPSFSPEHGKFCDGSSMDHQIAYEIFSSCIEASEILEIEPEFKKELEIAKEKIAKPRIGSWGQLQEWLNDWDNPNDKHRHVSHLYALFPSNSINNLKLKEAAKTSLNARGDSGTGWSIAWKINFWARLKDGNRAYKLIKSLMNWTNQKTVSMNFGGGLYSNLLDAHPPFQIDGNFGFVSGVNEMLIQSHLDNIEILPSLPKSWKNGEVKGLRARGGAICDIFWKNGKLTRLKISSIIGGRYSIVYKNCVKSIYLKANESLILEDF